MICLRVKKLNHPGSDRMFYLQRKQGCIQSETKTEMTLSQTKTEMSKWDLRLTRIVWRRGRRGRRRGRRKAKML
jgi:hypothetical protein